MFILTQDLYRKQTIVNKTFSVDNVSKPIFPKKYALIK